MVAKRREKYKLHEIKHMETKYFSLGSVENSSAIKIIRSIFGLACIAISIFWLKFNISSAKADNSLWITVSFLSGFGLYQIMAGLGRTSRFIQIGPDKIILKKNAVLPAKEMVSSSIKKIEVFPLNLIFYIHNGRKIVLRFGTDYIDIIEPIKNEIEEFATTNSIDIEILAEDI